MRVLSLFDGISCGMVALKNSLLPTTAYKAYEIDKYAIKVSQKNFPEIEQCGNVMDASFEPCDLLLGGSPCTYWSIAKKDREVTSSGLGWELFMQYVRAIEEAKPKYFIYENNYSIHKDIQSEITKALRVEPIMINSALVSAQNRKRLYWTNIPNVTQPEDKNILLKDILESGIPYQDKSYCLTASYNGAIFWNSIQRKQRTMVCEPVRLGHFGKGSQAQRIYSIEGKSVNLIANGGGQGAKTGLYRIDLPDGDYTVRKLTPIEAERLQTLPDNYTEGISKEQRYKCIGNGWTVDVISHILKGVSLDGTKD